MGFFSFFLLFGKEKKRTHNESEKLDPERSLILSYKPGTAAGLGPPTGTC